MIDHLIEAVIDNDAEKVERLLDKGADPNSKADYALISPLHYAAQNNSVQVIPLLIEAGANIYATDSDGEQTPLDVACISNNQEAVRVLLGYMSGNTSNRAH
jgi:ankyrin repeat protein